MPPLVPIIIGAAFAASGIGGIILGGITALTIGITGLGASLILGGLSRLLLPKFPSLAAFTQEARGRTVTARQPVAPWRVIYGEIRVGGVITFLHVTGTNKEFLHIVITISGHEVEQIGDMFFDGVLVPVDGSGDATGFFLDHVHREINLGTDTQTAFPGLLADAPTKWTANHRQLGRAGVYVRLKFNPDKFPGNIPNITFDVKGKKLYDPRTQSSIAAAPTGADRTANVVTITTTAAHGLAVNDRARVDGVTDGSFNGDFTLDTVPSATTFTYAQTAANATSGSGTAGKVAWSENAALCFSEYLLDTDYGVGVKLPRIDNPAWVAAANLCEEQVALAGGGFEDRYTCNGSFLVSQRMSDIMLALLTAMGGTSVYSGGFWFIYGAAWRGPTLPFDEGDLRGPIQVQARTGRRSLFNAVKGIYVSAANNWQPSDFPPVTNATYETEDGGTRIFKDIQLPYTISSATAQRLAKIELERARRQKTVKARFGPTALQAQPPDVIQFSVSRFSWVSKTFEIVNEQLILDQDEDGTPRQENLLTMRESDSTVYDWVAEESSPTTPGTPDLPDPTAVVAPTGLTLSSFSITRTDRIRITFLKAAWTAPADQFVTNGGKIEIQYKKNADSTWLPAGFVAGDAVQQVIPDVDDSVAYDVRIRSITVLGAKSAFVQQLNFTVTGVASPVDSDAANGEIAFLGTAEYRKAQDPTNNAIPTSLTSLTRQDGSVDVTLGWSLYVQGAVKAWALLIYVRLDGTLPTTADYYGMIGIDATAIKLVGLNPSTTYSFGIAAVRMLESGQVRTLISSPTSAPDWRGRTFGTPNFTGEVDGDTASDVRDGSARSRAGLDGLGDLARDILAARKTSSDILSRSAGGTFLGSLSATLGATWGVDLNSRPVELTDGRIVLGIDSSGNLLLKNVVQGEGVTASPTTTSTTFATLPEMTKTITTKGKSILIIFHGSFQRTVGTVQLQLRVVRDSTSIGKVTQTNFSNNNEILNVALAHIDPSPSAASHEYKIEWKLASGTGTIQAFGTIREIEVVELG